MADCSLCDNTGYRPIEPENRAAGVIPCDHRRNGAGFTAIGDCRLAIEDLLTPPEKQVRELILCRRGRQKAITIGQLAATVYGADRQHLGEWDSAVRSIKRTVEKLRTLARIPIAATKTQPYGYFLPATAEEGDECHDRLFTEGIRLIVLSQLFKRDADLMQALRGQLEFGARDSRYATRADPNPETRTPSPESRATPEAR
jgi:hypothetical protein